MNDKKIIYSMSGVGKVFNQKHVLKDISLGYYYGAKIGVLGLNGSGKSTLLKIMAGIDDNHLGEVQMMSFSLISLYITVYLTLSQFLALIDNLGSLIDI